MIDQIAADSLPDWLTRRAFMTPERLALIAGEVRWTFAELDARASQTARRLASLGISPGARVATLLRNSHHVALLVHGAPRLGAILVPLNTRLTPDELAWQLRDVGAELLVFDRHTAEQAAELRSHLPRLAMISVDTAHEEPSLSDLSEAQVDLRERHEPGEIHSIVYTSGTTGRPKGAMLTFGNHWWSAIGSALNLGMQADDRWLACLPLFHVGGMAILLRGAISGITAVVHEVFDPAGANRAIDDGVTIVSVVATMLQRMLAERGERPYPAWFRCALLGGGPAPRPLLEECARRGVPVVQTYGLTETASQVATLAPEEALTRLGSAGKPLYPNELRIVAEGGARPPGEPGEILVRGPVVTAGYFEKPEETARVWQNSWFSTGDYGFLDENGYLYVLDRRSDLIVSGGENVYPAEVEAVLLAHPLVEEAGVIGLPDPEWGQTAVAVVRLAAGAEISAEELRAFCRERLARYKVPSSVRFVETLPRTAAGKLLRRVLRDQERETRSQRDVPGAGGHP